MDNYGLKPCPFCGKEDCITLITKYNKKEHHNKYYVLCNRVFGGCDTSSGLYHYDDDAIDAWNRRVNNGDSTN